MGSPSRRVPWSIDAEIVTALRHHAAMGRPLETCGYLVGKDGHIDGFQPTGNLHPEPETRYEVDPVVYMDLEDRLEGSTRDVVGIFHSHPASPAVPSKTDRAHAQPGWIYLIHGFPGTDPEGELRGWSIRDPEADFKEQPLEITL